MSRHLVRQTDGPGRCPLKQAISASLSAIDPVALGAAARRQAQRLLGGTTFAGAPDLARLHTFSSRLPLHAVGDLLGVPDAQLPEVTDLALDLVGGFTAGAAPERLAKGNAAASRLVTIVSALLEGPLRAPEADGAGLIAAIAREAAGRGFAAIEPIVANAVGLLTQAAEATAGLIGNALAALSTQPLAWAEVQADRGLAGAAVAEALRWDPPVQNTRRYLAGEASIEGVRVPESAELIVLLAAACRDPAANAEPARFVLRRARRTTFGFGRGAHACPGESIAAAIAEAGLSALLDAGLDPSRLRVAGHQPSPNLRLPRFAAAEGPRS